MEKLIISYEQGFTNWYISEFYKYFHSKIILETEIKFEYLPIKQFALKFGKELDNNFCNIFNWYNLIIYNPKTEKIFVHSWNDYAPEILKYSIENNFNLVKLSCSSNLTDSIIEDFKGKIIVEPSVYCLENWKDIELLETNFTEKNRFDKAYFNGLNYGIRENILNTLSKFDFFNIMVKSNFGQFRQKNEYYEDLRTHKFGLSLNGAANICYRDLELFALRTLNLRQTLRSKTHDPLINGVHFVEFITDDFVQTILNGENVETLIKNKIEEILNFYHTIECKNILDASKVWFQKNCLPDNQYKIIVSFLDDFNIFE